MASENETTNSDPPKAEEEQQENVVNRVASLPFISSAYNLVSSAYSYTKGAHPYVRHICSIAEIVAAVAMGSAVGGVQPILSHLEPQIASVNECACKGLDQLEEHLPFLQEPAEKVISDTKQMVSSTVMYATDAAYGAKNAVASRVAGAIDVTKDVVQESVELTKSVVTSTVSIARETACGAKDIVTSKVNTAVGRSQEALQEGVEMTSSMVTTSINKAKAAGQLMASGVEIVLKKSETLVDHYLPMTEEELAELAVAVKGFDVASVEEQRQRQSYFVRLGSLSRKVRHRAYKHSLHKLQLVKQNTQDAVSQLQLAINLIEYVKQGIGQRLLDSQEKLQQLWMEWSWTQARGSLAKDASSQTEVETRTLAVVRIITQQLQPACENLAASLQGLPSSIQETVQEVVNSVQQLHASFSRADSFQDLSGSSLTQSQEKMTKTQESLDALLEYLAHNTPLNWLVGPFTPSVIMTQEATKELKEMMMTERSQDGPAAQRQMAEVPKAPEKEMVEALKEEAKVLSAPEESIKTMKAAIEEVINVSEKMVAEQPKEDP
ncbi:perilipin-3-like isoform X2 [Carettochelys insculpta]|uniref:perilipin-3-like isoform X2 n=1 Tax=Carettochelys insculpta TaxID=44489 RepID=UPI003EB7E3BA